MRSGVSKSGKVRRSPKSISGGATARVSQYDDDQALGVPDQVERREAVVNDAAGTAEERLDKGFHEVPGGVGGGAPRGGGGCRRGGRVVQPDEGGGVAAFEGPAGDAVKVGLKGQGAEHWSQVVGYLLEAAVGVEGGVEGLRSVAFGFSGQTVGK